MIRSESAAHIELQARAEGTVYDRIGRNALAYAPSMRNARTMRPGWFRRFLAWL